jgi:hypothetical protein
MHLFPDKMPGGQEKYYSRIGKSELPNDAQRLTLEEVQRNQWERIMDWKPRSKM